MWSQPVAATLNSRVGPLHLQGRYISEPIAQRLDNLVHLANWLKSVRALVGNLERWALPLQGDLPGSWAQTKESVLLWSALAFRQLDSLMGVIFSHTRVLADTNAAQIRAHLNTVQVAESLTAMKLS